MYSYRAHFGQTNNLWSTLTVQLIVLILNKKIIYGSTLDVQL